MMTRPGKPKIWQIVAAAAVGVGGVGLMLVERLWGCSPWVRTLSVLAAVAGTSGATLALVWRLVAARRAPREGVDFADSDAERTRAVGEARAAVRRYLRSARHSSMLARRTLYERPWFLVVGERCSGKTTLLERSGLDIPLRYPSEQDGLQPDDDRRATWHFGNEAVWIEAPGTYAGEGDTRRWQGLVGALAEVRRARAIDGMLLVVDVSKLCAAAEGAVKTLGERLRARIDEMIAAGGIEFPVYLMLSHADEVPGFGQMLGPAIERNGEQVLGAAFDSAALSMLPGRAFVREFGRLCEALADYRLLRLRRERDPKARRLICRFLIEAEALQEKIAALASELFKPSEYVGGPVFKGFYLTGCTEPPGTRAGDTAPTPLVSATIADHPLNPRRAAGKTSSTADRPADGPRAHFALPALRDMTRGGRTLVKKTQRAGRRALVRDIVVNAAAVVTAVVVAVLVLGARSEAVGVYRTVHERVSEAIDRAEGAELAGRYAMLGRVGESVERLETLGRRPFHMARLLGFYDSEALLERLEQPYVALLDKLIAAPAAACFEHELERLSRSYGDLDADRYDSLYLMLKSYLSIGETGAARGEAGETKGLEPVLRDAVVRSLLSALRTSRLPPAVSTVIERNLHPYVMRLAHGQAVPVAEDRKLVALARRRLRRLPNAHTLYRSVATRLSAGAPSFTLDTIIGGDHSGHLVSDGAVSTIYTAAGWQTKVRNGLDASARDPVASDWVLGVVADVGRPATRDADQLRAQMHSAYAQDFVDQWTAFLKGIRLRRWGSLAECAGGLRELAAGGSEVETLFKAVAALTTLRMPDDGAKERLGALAGKAVPGVGDSAAARAAGLAGLGGRRGPLEKASATFDPLRAFVEQQRTGELGLPRYRALLGAVADELDKTKDAGPAALVNSFGGGVDDPLYDAWRRTEAYVAGLPSRMREPVGAVLLAPLRETGRRVSVALAQAVNSTWESGVAEPFRRRLAGRFPLEVNADEAPYDDVMDFFRPNTGVLWGFYERALSSFIIKRDGAWHGRTVGCVDMAPTEQLCVSLSAAERITRRFFLSDGEVREMVLTITPVGNGRPAELTVDGQKVTLTPGGSAVRMRWPLDAPTRGAALQVRLSDGSTRRLAREGPWGLMRLLQGGRLSAVTEQAFTVVWSVDVQRMFIIPLTYRVAVSGDGHPFVRNPFASFRCPDRAVRDPSGKTPAVAATR